MNGFELRRVKARVIQNPHSEGGIIVCTSSTKYVGMCTIGRGGNDTSVTPKNHGTTGWLEWRCQLGQRMNLSIGGVTGL